MAVPTGATGFLLIPGSAPHDYVAIRQILNWLINGANITVIGTFGTVQFVNVSEAEFLLALTLYGAPF